MLTFPVKCFDPNHKCFKGDTGGSTPCLAATIDNILSHLSAYIGLELPPRIKSWHAINNS